MPARPFAVLLVGLRHAAGVTQEELARSSGVSVRTLQNYETGRREPRWSHVVALADALKVCLGAFHPRATERFIPFLGNLYPKL
jgi:transcriptional regulator with XRE-family HTH domain